MRKPLDTMAGAEEMVLRALLKDDRGDSILTRLARVGYRSETEEAAINNVRTVLAGILEE